MCFRPTEVSADVHCPNCGKKINKTQGLYPKKCPFCKTVFAEIGWDPAAAAEEVTVPEGAPAAPAAPGAPSAPKAPGAPAAPKAPTAPGAPKAPNA